jgi:glycosyltransferase involved in cell wall biosynthesis
MKTESEATPISQEYLPTGYTQREGVSPIRKTSEARPLEAMKVLFVIPSITNYFTFLEELANNLCERGAEVHLATSRRHIASIESYRRDVVCTVHHIDFPRTLNPARHLMAAKNLRTLVQKLQPHTIHVHFSAALFTTMLAKTKKWPVTIGTLHGLGSPLIKGWRKSLIAAAEGWSSRRADAVFVLTGDDLRYLEKIAPKARVNLLRSCGVGCDLDRFNPIRVSAERKDAIRKELSIGPEHFVYIFIGRQTYFKGFDKVVKAFAQVRHERPKSLLLLVGEKDHIHATGQRQRSSLPATPHDGIIHVGWRENVQDYIAISHLNVFPSTREGLPVNLMESLAMGVPVLTVNSRGCRDVVHHNVNGWVLDEGNVENIAQAMLHLQDDHDARTRLSLGALQGRNRFDRAYFIEEQCNLLSALADVRR